MSLITESQTQDARTRADPSAPWEPVFVFTRYRANWIYIVLAWNNTKTFNQLKLGTTILHKVTVGANYAETEQCGDGIRHSDASLKELSHSRLGRRLITGEQTHQHTTFCGSKGTGFSLSRRHRTSVNNNIQMGGSSFLSVVFGSTRWVLEVSGPSEIDEWCWELDDSVDLTVFTLFRSSSGFFPEVWIYFFKYFFTIVSEGAKVEFDYFRSLVPVFYFYFLQSCDPIKQLRDPLLGCDPQFEKLCFKLTFFFLFFFYVHMVGKGQKKCGLKHLTGL